MRILALLLVAVLSVPAQTTDASITGTVVDPQGAVIVSASVTATHVDTGARSTTITNHSGFYTLRPLSIGKYLVEVEMKGFRRELYRDVELTTGQSLELNAALEVGTVGDSITVTERPSLLETRNSDGSQLIESKTIEDMPLGDRRSMNLIELTGAAVFVNYESGGKPNFSLAGGRTQSQMFLIDGGSGQNMRIGVGQIDADPPVETLAEIKIMGNGFSAEFGGSAGGMIVANTKSGTNRIKGSLFEYLRNQVLDAPAFFSPIVNGAKQKPSLRYNVFGGVIGGPLRRNKTFFFGSYEGSRRRDGSIRNLTVPTELERQGNFTQTFNTRGPAIVYDPFTGRREGTANVRDPFPENIVPTSRWDPISSKFLQFFPLPNRAGDDATRVNNYRANDVNALTRDNYLLKLDHHLGSKNTMAFRWTSNTDLNKRNSVYPTADADPTNQSNNKQTFWYGTWTRILSPSRINEIRLTYGRRKAHTFSRGFGQNWPSKLGIKGVSDDAFPRVESTAYAALGSTNQERNQFPIQQYHLAEGFTWVRGTHTVKIGGEIRPSMNYEIFRPYASGRFTFDRGFTAAINNQAFSGNGIATMLLGIPGTVDVRETDTLERRSFYLAWYAQNDWNVRPGLTLNMGVRWEVDTPFKDSENRFNGFDMNAINPVSGTPGVVKFGGIDGYRTSPFDGDYNNYGPRIGFAWRPFQSKTTVIRGGYGIYFAHPFDRAVANAVSLGFERSLNLNIVGNIVPIPYTMSNNLPIATKAPALVPGFGSVPVGTTATNAVTFFQTDRTTGYSQQFSLRVQREILGGTLVEVAFLGNASKKLASANLPINQIPPDKMEAGSGQKDRPYPQYSNVSLVAPNIGVSNYYAMAIKAEKRFSRGFNILSTYTFSKFLDNADGGGGASLGDEGAAYSNFYNRRADYGPSENDIRSRLTFSSVYQLPFGRGRAYLGSSPLRPLVGGWSIGTVMLLQSGPPVTVATQQNTTFSNSAGALRADVIREPNLAVDQRTIAKWFDTGAFTQPAQYTFGNQGVGLIRAPGVINLNMSLIRTFKIAERYQFQFRGESFNIANHPNFGTPNRVYEGPGFGVIDSSRPGRQIQIGLRLTY
ncbi:MAG: carboxypeptidase-like regulatory domain-containing protein [Bryobacteraceae bacterium]|nr:carboxypeptidase-like regulatory domain-containing protein [Bryobacteraceae bacterium]